MQPLVAVRTGSSQGSIFFIVCRKAEKRFRSAGWSSQSERVHDLSQTMGRQVTSRCRLRLRAVAEFKVEFDVR
jgi:hypothetical protein